MTKENPWPEGRPGSDEAIKHGCICPVLDNGHGNPDLPQYWIHADCPVHRSTQALREYDAKERAARLLTE